MSDLTELLAPEIKISISQWLSHEKADLKALSLVSRTWLAPARAILFQTLRSRLKPSVLDLTSFLRSHPHVAAFVLELILDSHSLSLTPEIPELYALVAAIPNIRALTLYQCGLFKLTLGPVVPKTVVSLTLPRLTVSVCVLSRGALHQLLTDFGGDTLILVDTSIYTYSDDEGLTSTDSSLLSTISRLHITGLGHDHKSAMTPPFSVHPKSILRQELLHACHGRLSALAISLDLVTEARLNEFRTFLMTKGAALKSLRLDYPQPSGRVENTHILGLGHADNRLTRLRLSLSSCCPHLTTVTFTSWLMSDYAHANASFYPWRHALLLLATIPSSVTTVTIGLKDEGMGTWRSNLVAAGLLSFGGVTWSEWDQVVAGLPHLKCLEVVTLEDRYLHNLDTPPYNRLFHQKHVPNPFDFKEYLRGCLPKAHARGILLLSV